MNELPASLIEGLRGRYRLERELGRGGMATVYLAQDLKHDRPVALKVLRRELAAALGPDRFQREIRVAARLQHPHILTVHDSGEAAGSLWFTMPFVEGESLRDRLDRERQLPVAEALRIGGEVAQGLQYAHDHGVIHRDIKPANILLLRDGSTLVADFGIARAVAGGEQRLTETGLSVGTPAYMSPEQATGDDTLDARTDVYSLGCVLYEMLVGEPPFAGPTAQAILAKRFTEAAPSARRLRTTVPEAVDQAIQRALAPIAADRFTSASELAGALQGSTATVPAPENRAVRRRLPAAVLMLLLGFTIGLGVLFAWRGSRGGPVTTLGPKRIAVLPFDNMGDSSDAYFADGMTDEVRGKLSQLSGIAVIARASSDEYRHSGKSPQDIARELGAEYLLTATVRWDKPADGPSRVRVSPELLQVEADAAPTTRWQQAFDASLTDVFQVQADIAGRVASALDVALGDSARQELAAKPTDNLAAYDAFLKGETFSQAMGTPDPGALRRAIASYEQAVALDPGFVPAWAQLSRARSRLYFNSTPTPELAEGARIAAERAQALGPKRPEGRLALGEYYRLVLVDLPKALAALEEGLTMAPNDVELLSSAGGTEQTLGQWSRAVPHLTRAATLDPRSAGAARRLGSTLLWLRRYADARQELDRALALAPTHATTIENRAMLDLAQGDLPGARGLVSASLATADTVTLIATFANFWDLTWVLDDVQQRRLLTLPASAWDNDQASRSFVFVQTYHLRGDTARVRIYADSARAGFAAQSRAAPDNAQLHVLLGLSLAYLGRKAEAIAEGKRGVALQPLSQNGFNGPYFQHQLARIYLLVGEPEKALDQLEPLLEVPYYLSPGWLRIDPTFAPLKGNPRFERLIAAAPPRALGLAAP